ncbi:MAG: hypothetical protein GXY76_17840 [Chloroflexi bacterium]|mgnify:CR=1 FL=1|nr:hypothetical protein [Chloroflexota bacterium]
MAKAADRVLFQRQSEPREGAFTFLVPQGWTVEGGIVRADHLRQVVNAQSIEAKLDLAVMADAAGRVMFRWCPAVKYSDPRHVLTAQMGWMPVGSVYQGTLLYPAMPAAQFIEQMLFPWAHPQGQDARVIEEKPHQDKAQEAWQRSVSGGGLQTVVYDAASVTYTYAEGGVRFKETAYTLIESLGQAAAGLWTNLNTVYWRAPEAEFDDWAPVLRRIRESDQANPRWLAEERVSQEVLSMAFANAQAAERYRAQRALEVQRQIQSELQQMLDHKRQVQSDIRYDQNLALRGQEEYYNPVLERHEYATNAWQHRWVNKDGLEFYTNCEGDDPNRDELGGRRDWQRSPVDRQYPR